MLKTIGLLNFIFSGFFEEYFFFCNVVNVFAVIFDQFNASVLNKSITFLKNNILLTPNFLTIVYILVLYTSSEPYRTCMAVSRARRAFSSLMRFRSSSFFFSDSAVFSSSALCSLSYGKNVSDTFEQTITISTAGL